MRQVNSYLISPRAGKTVLDMPMLSTPCNFGMTPAGGFYVLAVTSGVPKRRKSVEIAVVQDDDVLEGSYVYLGTVVLGQTQYHAFWTSAY